MLQPARRSYEQQGVESGAPDISFCNLDSENLHNICIAAFAEEDGRERARSVILLKFKIKLT